MSNQTLKNLTLSPAQNKPKTCSQCGYYRKRQPCRVGYYTTATTKACKQAHTITTLYQKGCL